MNTNLQLVQPDFDMNRFQLFVIDCPYNSFSNPMTQNLFGKFISSKLDGFLAEYEHGILPLGAYDFVGTLILLCEKQGENYEPVFCFKSTSQERSDYFGLPFELMGAFREGCDQTQKEAIVRILRTAKSKNINVGYNSSWTILPKWRSDSALRSFSKDLSCAVLASYYRGYNIEEVLIAGVVRFKVDKLQAFIGFEYISENGKQIDPIGSSFLNDEQIQLMHLKQFTPEVLALAEKYKSIWENRVVIEDAARAFTRKKAA